jgi:hypothetical protein
MLTTKQKHLYIELLYDNTDESNYVAYTLKNMYMPRYFYKYRRINDYTIKNLLDSSIYMSSPNDFNDPYDSAICNDVSESLSMGLFELRSQMFISCFSEKWDSLLMWSHYADCHKGICIQYDFALQHRKKGNCIFPDIHPVIYTDRVFSVTDGNSLQCSAFVKAKEWKYEKEWRIIADNMQKKSFNMKIPTPVNSIILGCKISNDDKESIHRLASELNIKLFQIIMIENAFKLKKLPI